MKVSLDLRERVLVTSTAAALVVLLPGVPAAIRVPVGVWFFCACPGLAWLRTLPVEGPVEQAAVVVALSLALDVVVAQVLLFAGASGIVPAALALAAVTLGGMAHGRRWGSDSPDQPPAMQETAR